jgi:hypothetical protein
MLPTSFAFMDAVLYARPHVFGTSSLWTCRSTSRRAVRWCVAPLSTTHIGSTGSATTGVMYSLLVRKPSLGSLSARARCFEP